MGVERDPRAQRCPAAGKRACPPAPCAHRMVRSSGGFSLPELLITLVVSSLLVGGMVSGYLVQKGSYENEGDLIDMQMNARLAMERIAEVVRDAGLGCKENFPPDGDDVVDGPFRSFSQVFTAVDRDDGPDMLTVVTGLRVRTRVESIAPDHVVLEEILNPNGVPLFDTDKKSRIFFSPQGENRFLTVLAVDPTTRAVSLSEPCADTESSFCSVREGDDVFRVNAYTITLDQNGTEWIDVDGDGSVADRDGDLSPDLYIYANINDLVADFETAGPGQASVSASEMAEGIEALQFRYGWDVDGNGRITDAEFVDDPTGNESEIRAVRIYLLARSRFSDPRYTDPNDHYDLANQTLTVDADASHYHRQLLVETVMVRNLNL